MNVAVTAVLEFTVTDAGFVVPVRPTLHPANDQPMDGVAVSCTVEPAV